MKKPFCTEIDAILTEMDMAEATPAAVPVAPPVTSVRVPGFVIDLARDELRTITGALVDLRPRSFAVLRLLALHAGRMVTKDAIMDAVWPDTIVTEDSLTQCVADIRRAIGDSDRKSIRTVPRRGYLLEVEAAPLPAEAPSTTPIPSLLGWRRRAAIGGVLAALAALVLLVVFWPTTSGRRTELAPKSPDRPSLAVLPFKATVPGPRNDLLAIGLATEVLNELVRNKDLRIIARDSSFALGARNLSPREIGAQLRVRYLVDGTVERTADTLTVKRQYN